MCKLIISYIYLSAVKHRVRAWQCNPHYALVSEHGTYTRIIEESCVVLYFPFCFEPQNGLEPQFGVLFHKTVLVFTTQPRSKVYTPSILFYDFSYLYLK
jgi:hypothetical protein